MPAVPALFAEGLSVRLGSTRVLEGVDLRVDRGDLYGLLGRNGAGKTTSMRCLLGLLPRARGRAEVFGVPSAQLHTCPEPLGVAMDPPGLDDTLTVRQNLELARVRAGLRAGRGVDEALELVGLAHRAHHRGDRLSHGQGRRAAVARALLGSPRLLILDEPLSGLDPEGVEVLLALFRRLAHDEGVTVVLSSHHLREVQAVCTRVGMIEAGRTVLEGEVDTLLQGAGDRIRIRAGRPDAVRRALSGREVVRAIEEESGALLVRVDPGAPGAPLLQALVQAGCEVEEFARERASLVDVFQQAVAGARDAEAAA